MLSREQMLSILNTMDEAHLAQALGAAGVDMPVGEMDLGEETGDELQSWNARDVALPPPNKPNFFDKGQFVKAQQLPTAPPPQYAPALDDMDMVDESVLPYQPMMD